MDLRALGDELAVERFSLAHFHPQQLALGQGLLGNPRRGHRRRAAGERPQHACHCAD